jgi:hypothetical protein
VHRRHRAVHCGRARRAGLIAAAAAAGEHSDEPEQGGRFHCALVLSVPVLSVVRGPRVSWGADVGDGLVMVVSTLAALSGIPTLSGVTVAAPGRPAVPGGPVRVESMTCTVVVVSAALGAGPAWSSFRLWQAAIVAAVAARKRIFFMPALPVRGEPSDPGLLTYPNPRQVD